MIEEKIETRASLDEVWNAWSKNYLQAGFKKNQKSYVVTNRTRMKFKIEDVIEKQSFTITWYSYFARLVFYHKVEKTDQGSRIYCRVKVKGFFAFLLRSFMERKIKFYIQKSLKTFTHQLEMNL